MPKRWSTKNLIVVEEPTHARSGIGVFEFTDDYSVFHYGKMPDSIPGKGEAICRMAVANFLLLEQQGIETHFRKFIPPNKIEFRLVRVLDPAQRQINCGERNYLIPLQVIFRNTLPAGASVFRRLQRGEVTVNQLGLTKMPEPGDRLQNPLIEFTTKLEEIDRFINEEEAKTISGLSEEQMDHLKQFTLNINELITQKAASVGLEHADGKIEFGVTESGSIMLVDNAGTPDENRFTFNGFHITKQIMRNYYLGEDLEKKVQVWAATKRPRELWPKPKPLPFNLLCFISDMYKSLCEAWISQRIWGAPSLDEIVRFLRSLNTHSMS